MGVHEGQYFLFFKDTIPVDPERAKEARREEMARGQEWNARHERALQQRLGQSVIEGITPGPSELSFDI